MNKIVIVITTFLLFVGTGMLSTASAERILDFGVISQASGFTDSDFSIDKAVLKLFNKEEKKELKEEKAELKQHKNDLDLTTQDAEGVGTWGDDLILAEGVALNSNNVEGNGITYTSVSDGMTATPSSVTEPGTAFLLGSGLIGLVGMRRRKFAKKALPSGGDKAKNVAEKEPDNNLVSKVYTAGRA
ncbi:MAG: PEP-CTERM sorting domain-containing protein [Desulfobacterales bacterium]